MIYSYDEVKHVHFEPTQKCQASCPMCDRNENGGPVNRHLTDADVSLEQFKEWFPIEFLNHIDNMYFCGNHGDPILCPDLLEIVKYAKSVAPNLHMHVTTNGGARPVSWWEELAQYIDHVNFSVDGLWDTNHIYRQGVSWPKVEENMEAFIHAGGSVIWTFLVFGHNEHQVEEARQYSQMLGVDKFVVKKTGRYVSANNTVKREAHQAIDRKGNPTAVITKPKKEKYRNTVLEKEYHEIVEKYGSIDAYTETTEIDPKCVSKKEIYVNATGTVWPCCWTQGQFMKFWRDIEDSLEYKMLSKSGGIDTIDLNKTPLKQCIESTFFDNIEASWKCTSVGEDGRLRVCGTKCNKGFDPFSAQWK